MADHYPTFTEEELQNEIWKDVPEFEGVYSVSNLGRVRRDRLGKGVPAGTRIMRPHPDKDGYLFVLLTDIPKRQNKWIHTLVALVFIGPKPEGKEVNHKDTIKKNNRVSNLEYLTHKENMEHAHRNVVFKWRYGDENGSRTKPERLVRGEQHHKSKLTERQVKEIRARAKAGEKGVDIAKDYPVGVVMVRLIIRGEYWQHVI